jgi:APA family basic amino acid/polyamine antiporter
LFVNTFFTRPREAALGMVLMLTGVPMYYWFKRKNVQSDNSDNQ